jgi:hypothetical protein
MQEKLLALMDKDSLESRRKTKLSLPRVAMLQGEFTEYPVYTSTIMCHSIHLLKHLGRLFKVNPVF